MLENQYVLIGIGILGTVVSYFLNEFIIRFGVVLLGGGFLVFGIWQYSQSAQWNIPWNIPFFYVACGLIAPILAWLVVHDIPKPKAEPESQPIQQTETTEIPSTTQPPIEIPVFSVFIRAFKPLQFIPIPQVQAQELSMSPGIFIVLPEFHITNQLDTSVALNFELIVKREKVVTFPIDVKSERVSVVEEWLSRNDFSAESFFGRGIILDGQTTTNGYLVFFLSKNDQEVYMVTEEHIQNSNVVSFKLQDTVTGIIKEFTLFDAIKGTALISGGH